MSLFFFLMVVQAIIGASLVAVILMQQSEGGGLGMGGSPGGMMSVRGAADFMTRATAILATVFVVLSIALAALAVGQTSGREIDTSLDRSVEQSAPAVNDPLAPATGEGDGASAPAATAPQQSDDPLAGAAQ